MAYNDLRYLQAANSYGVNNSGYQAAPVSGIGGTYDTPGYGEGYRPSYGEANYDPYNPWHRGDGPGRYMWNAAGALPPPFGMGTDAPLHENPSIQTQYAGQAIASTGADAGANLAQQYILPFAAYYAGYKIHKSKIFYTAAGRDMYAGTAAGRAVGRGVGSLAGGVIGGAWNALTGFGSRSGGAALGAAALGGAGMAAGSLLTPMLLGMGISHAIDTAVFQPYIDTRRASTAMQTAMSNRIVTGSAGAPSGGLGMSGYAAARSASAITSGAWDDFALSNSQYTSLVDYGMQSGLYDSMGTMDPKQMAAKTKDIAKDVKRIMQVFGEKDMREAVAILSEFTKQGGVAGGYETTTALNSLRMGTLMTGKSSREIYDLVGASGAGAYQAQGMSGMAGIINATGAYAGLANAQRMGLVSSRMLSLFGGIEGATGMMVRGRADMAGTDYNKMMMYNQFLGGGAKDSIGGNINEYASLIGSNPLAAAGKMALHAQEMLDAQAKGSPTSVYMQYVQQLKAMYPNKTSFSTADMAGLLHGNGFSDQQVNAAMLDIQGAKRGFNKNVTDKFQTDAIHADIEANGWSYMGSLGTSLHRGAYGAMQALSPLGEKPVQWLGYAGDQLSKGISWLRFGTSDEGRIGNAYVNGGAAYDIIDTASLDNGFYGGAEYGWINDSDEVASSKKAIAETVNKAASGVGGQEALALARKIMSNKGTGADVNKLEKLMGSEVSSSAMAYDFTKLSLRTKTLTPTGTKISRLSRTDEMFKLFGNDSGPTVSIGGSKGRGARSDKGVSLTRNQLALKDANDDTRKAYYAAIGAYVNGRTPEEIASMLQNLDPDTRKETLSLLGMVDTDQVSAVALEKRLGETHDVNRLDDIRKSKDGLVMSETAWIEDGNGGIRVSTTKEMESKAVWASKLKAMSSRSANTENVYLANRQALQAAMQADKMFTGIGDDFETTTLAGDDGSKIQAKAALVFAGAVDKFADKVQSTGPDAQRAKIEAGTSTKNRWDMTSGELLTDIIKAF